METYSIVLVETSLSRSRYVYIKTVANFKTFSLQICNGLRQVWGYKTSLTLNKTFQKRVHVVVLFSLLHVLKMKFKGSGRFRNVSLLGDDLVLNTLYLGTSSSRLADVEWFTGM